MSFAASVKLIEAILIGKDRTILSEKITSRPKVKQSRERTKINDHDSISSSRK